jgi:hypothetical protein
MTIFENVPQDTIKFELTFETGLTLDTIRMSVPVHFAQLGASGGDEMMTRVKSALKLFIADASWNFSDIRRSQGADGIERVNLTATARVKTGEDADLKSRIDSINTRGLTLGTPSVDYTFPLPYLNENRAALRKTILRAAQAECDSISTALARTYRLAEVRFETADEGGRKDVSYMSNSMSRDTASASSGGSTVHSEKMFMTAEITLAVVAPVPANGKKDK